MNNNKDRIRKWNELSNIMEWYQQGLLNKNEFIIVKHNLFCNQSHCYDPLFHRLAHDSFMSLLNKQL